MRICSALIVACAVASWAPVSPAAADDQTIQAVLTLNGFNNSNISTAFKTTDVFDAVHSCSAGSTGGCTASNSYGSPPKNVGNILCLPSNLIYTVTSGCQAILTAGSTQNCKGNPIQGWCGSNANVTASCAWRTNNNKNTTPWNWTLNFANGIITVDCSNSNYQGYTP